jgi:hypothetical protein
LASAVAALAQFHSFDSDLAVNTGFLLAWSAELNRKLADVDPQHVSLVWCSLGLMHVDPAALCPDFLQLLSRDTRSKLSRFEPQALADTIYGMVRRLCDFLSCARVCC